jgi:hypothetical protein
MIKLSTKPARILKGIIHLKEDKKFKNTRGQISDIKLKTGIFKTMRGRKGTSFCNSVNYQNSKMNKHKSKEQ